MKKRGRLVMEQPEVFKPQADEAVAHSMQAVYGQTRGLSNKTIVKAQQQALEVRRLEREYMPAGLRRKYELAEINYAMEHIHFPADRTELLFARKRLVFDEFFMFLVGVRRMKEHREDKHSPYVMSAERIDPETRSVLPHLSSHIPLFPLPRRNPRYNRSVPYICSEDSLLCQSLFLPFFAEYPGLLLH